MPEPINCPSCGASNPAGSSWCSLCFERFGLPEPGPQPERDSATPQGPERGESDLAAPAAPPPPPAEGEQLALLEVGDDSTDKTWTCRFCETRVPVGQVQCPACQQTIYDSFGGRPPAVEVDPMDALRRSALPGGGHFLLQQSLIGGAILVLTIISVAMGIYLLVAGVTGAGAALTFMGMTLWMLAAHDAFRIASGHGDEIFLRPRVISVVAVVWFVLVIWAAVQAQRVIE